MALKTEFLKVLDELYKNKLLPASERKQLAEFSSLVKKHAKDADYAKILIYSLVVFARFEDKIKKNKLFLKVCQDCAAHLSEAVKSNKPTPARKRNGA